jgi:hypothetical protein
LISLAATNEIKANNKRDFPFSSFSAAPSTVPNSLFPSLSSLRLLNVPKKKP